MLAENKIINGLWIGTELSVIELLTMQSFIHHGHTFQLWIYESLISPIPDGVVVKDAATIISRDKVFSYAHRNQFGHGQGSYAGFSDIFRYKLLYDFGGWWVDMDVTCLRPFDFEEAYFFRPHHELAVVGNVMKCPPHSELMKSCYDDASSAIDQFNTDWHKPIEILNQYIDILNLKGYIHTSCSNQDLWHFTSRYIRGANSIPDNWYFIHWQNEMWRHEQVSKTSFYDASALSQLLAKYHLYKPSKTILASFINRIAHSAMGRTLLKLGR